MNWVKFKIETSKYQSLQKKFQEGLETKKVGRRPSWRAKKYYRKSWLHVKIDCKRLLMGGDSNLVLMDNMDVLSV